MCRFGFSLPSARVSLELVIFWCVALTSSVSMKPRDIVLLATFVNSILLGFLLVLSKPQEGTIYPSHQVEAKTVAIPVLVQEETEVVEAEPVLIIPQAPVVPTEEWYVMKSGDNPWKVAKNNKIKFDDLLKLNGLNEERARNLKPGDRIRIR